MIAKNQFLNAIWLVFARMNEILTLATLVIWGGVGTQSFVVHTPSARSNSRKRYSAL